MLLQIAIFHSFYGWVVFHCVWWECVCVCVYIYIYTHLLYPPSVSGHLGCFHTLGIINSAVAFCDSLTHTFSFTEKFTTVRVLSHVWLFATPRTIACQVLLSMEFSRQEHWSGLPLPIPSTEARFNMFDNKWIMILVGWVLWRTDPACS